MTSRIYNLNKTEHFMLRQWQRKIEDALLLTLFKQVKHKRDKSLNYIAVNSFLLDLKNKGYYVPFESKKENLIIGVEGCAMVTLFLEDDLWKYFKNCKGEIKFIG